ncbi:hypothetical protein [Methanooceanicella nereidis]|nr:hypothetical protein [Methanocella sp. CWC-04]
MPGIPKARTGNIRGLLQVHRPGHDEIRILLELGFAVVFGIVVPVYAFMANTGWNALQLMVAALIAFDPAGVSSRTRLLPQRDGIIAKDRLRFRTCHLSLYICFR